MKAREYFISKDHVDEYCHECGYGVSIDKKKIDSNDWTENIRVIEYSAYEKMRELVEEFCSIKGMQISYDPPAPGGKSYGDIKIKAGIVLGLWSGVKDSHHVVEVLE